MNGQERSAFMRLLDRHRITHRTATGSELSILCPRCGSGHNTRRLTLYINMATDYWLCHRCEPRQAGRDLNGLVRLLGLENFWKGIEALPDPTDLSVLRQKLIRIGTARGDIPSSLILVTLPNGYRTDWEHTVTGKRMVRCLSLARGLSKKAILQQISSCSGYSLLDRDVSGRIIFPVRMDYKLVYWQARRVLFGGNDRGQKWIGPAANKKGVLYGYDAFRGAKVTLVEGIFDALAIGPSTIALLGKAISDEQIALLAKLNIKEVEVIMDGDAWKAGLTMASKIKSRLWTAKHVSALRLPLKYDPAMAYSGKRKPTFLEMVKIL